MGFKQSNTHLDVRLAFGYVAVVAAALAGGYDYKIGFEKAKLYTAIGVVVYFAAYAAMNLWQFVVERNLVFAGSKDDVSVCLSENRCPRHSIGAGREWECGD